MNCQNHPEVPATAYCRSCGKPVCEECRRDAFGTVYCEEHVPAPPPRPADSAGFAAPPPGYTAAPPPPPPFAPNAAVPPSAGIVYADVSPGLALFLGLIPGVGAIYNAEYFKAALHLLIFGTLVTIVDSAGRNSETLFGLLAFGFYAYMPFEAFYTAKKRKLAREGINLITPFDQLNEQMGQFGGMELWGGIGLVLAGMLFLLDNFHILSLEQVGRFWPALLILAGVAFISRFRKGNRA